MTGDRQPKPPDDDDPAPDSDPEEPTERGDAEDITADFDVEIEVDTKVKLFRLRLRARRWDTGTANGLGLFANQTAVVIPPAMVASWLALDQFPENAWVTNILAVICLGVDLMWGRCGG